MLLALSSLRWRLHFLSPGIDGCNDDQCSASQLECFDCVH